MICRTCNLVSVPVLFNSSRSFRMTALILNSRWNSEWVSEWSNNIFFYVRYFGWKVTLKSCPDFKWPPVKWSEWMVNLHIACSYMCRNPPYNKQNAVLVLTWQCWSFTLGDSLLHSASSRAAVSLPPVIPRRYLSSPFSHVLKQNVNWPSVNEKINHHVVTIGVINDGWK